MAKRRAVPQRGRRPAAAAALAAALANQAATAEILKVIARSPSDTQPVFDAIARSARKLLRAHYANVTRLVDGELHLAANAGASASAAASLRKLFPAKVTGQGALGKAVLSGKPTWVTDVDTDRTYSEAFRKGARARGYRSLLAVPMLRRGVAIGTIAVTRREPGRFSADQIGLLQTFADQAVIAIENVRLFNETKEALERQTATAEILKVIAGSPSDVQPVFDAIAASARRLLDARAALVARRVGEQLELVAYTSAGEAEDAALRKLFPTPITGKGHLGKAILSAAPVRISDIQNDESYSEAFREIQRVRGLRSVVSVPMLREGKAIGVISVNRPVAGEFSEHQTNLLKTFADQAVIAIENVRLFNETQEALERQTATAEILKVISGSPTDEKPVFEAIVASAARLFARTGRIRLVEGGELHLRARSDAGRVEPSRDAPIRIDNESLGGRVVLERRALQVGDTLDAKAPAFMAALGARGGYRAMAAAPLLREGAVIGVISVTSPEPGALSDKEMTLLQTFADQAVIAIENARLFNETKESLERQTATADILRVIAGTPTDTRPVFDAIVEAAHRLAGGKLAALLLREGDHFIAVANSGQRVIEGLPEDVRKVPLDRQHNFPSRAILDRETVYVADWTAPEVPEFEREVAKAWGHKSGVVVPLIRQGEGIGALALVRETTGAYQDKEVGLLRSFADQAVIAIENVRLFNETKEALEQQTAISEILRVISSSPSDVKPVLDAVAMRAARICEASDARIFLVEGSGQRYAAGFGDIAFGSAIGEVIPLTRGGAVGRAIIDRTPIHLEDMLAQPEEEYPVGREAAMRRGWRTVLAVPLMREAQSLGGIILRRKEVKPFSEKQVELLKTFADQSAIAIENVRLFNAIKETLEQQTATTEVLNVISSSITDPRPAFDAIARSVLKLYGARSVGLVVRIGEKIDRVGYALSDASADDGSQALWPIPLDDRSFSGRAILGGDLVHIRDAQTEEGMSEHSRAITQRTGVRSVLVAPMHSMGTTTGALTIARRSPGGFSEREVEMVRTFADQAVIAMENARLFREIEEKSAQLEVASQHKSQFLASMSHELRTPLNALLGFNEMILGDIYGEVPGDMRAPLLQMQASGKHLLRLINNVLDLAKIEAGRMELALADYSVQDTVEGVHSTLRPLAAEKGLDFVAEVPADIPLAYGDGGRITQCLMNLAGNSLKFTKSGKVEISVAADNGLLRYRVSDTGIGIPADKIGSLFTEFKQTDATIASEYGGTGLGLAISKKFVEMHGGRIWVESAPGKGSVFAFEVPLRAGVHA